MKNTTVAFIAIVILVIASMYIMLKQPNQPQSQVNKNYSTPTPAVLGSAIDTSKALKPRIKTSGCKALNSLPDSDCTPGAIFSNATKDQICTPGYSKTVRNVSVATKKKVYEEYGIVTHVTGQYEVDHHVSLELGGSNDIANLWPEAAEPKPGFHQKDQVENYLHNKVCDGEISVYEAQMEIASNWLQVYNRMLQEMPAQ